MKTKYFIYAFAAILSMSACKTKSKTGSSSGTVSVNSGERDGSSFEKAIIVEEKTESAGVDAEYKWLAQHYPGYKLQQQSLLMNSGKSYDKMHIKTAQGEVKDIYFDISNFFGKW